VGEPVIIRAEPLEPVSWEPFGWMPVLDTDPNDGAHTLEFTWHDPHLNVISHAPTEIVRTEAGLLVDRLYRHDSHTQALMPLNCESVVVVAPAAVDFSDPRDLDQVRAFHLRLLDRLVLHRGTWHWGPFPLGDEPVQLLNVQGRRYEEDNASVDLAHALGVTVTVLIRQ